MDKTRPAALAAVVVGLVPLGAAPASAGPLEGINYIECSNEVTYLVSSEGKGYWAPLEDYIDEGTFVPTAYTRWSYETMNADGEVVDEGTYADRTKGKAGKNRADLLTCDFTLYDVVEDPEQGTLRTFTYGRVTGFYRAG